MLNFEDVLTQYEPMISACIRQLNIYRGHEQFRQTGRVALWLAWERFDDEKGDFTPFAYRSIRGAMMDEMRKENRFEEHHMPTGVDKLTYLIDVNETEENCGIGRLENVIESLTENDRKLLQWLFIDACSQAECAKRFGISVPGVKKRRERVLQKIRELLERGKGF
ncbi:sigma-70 family RNA polymerase sigma factor [Sporosarcina highlanderae]|uniref:Sigma-70 family RNA polymerase sigma factor n=1 Tax=Sporosarcina highlanderae TaxID=3035916 RepID=A0ABT8JL74_9BACL|nr:sigma-70 family RNA polymerase sigma factor [Sporosarcina highlanderae]MDN4605906.1 sigma-70 family RNA polymerase sigma factor [Sporosarcina highlanderae]